MKLIQTKNYLLLIDEEAEIKDGDYVTGDGLQYLSGVVNKVTQIHNGGIIVNNFTKLSMKGSIKITAYYPLTKEAKELDLPWLPKPFECVDIENLANKHYEKHQTPDDRYSLDELIQRSGGYIVGFKEGYKAAQSKQFSLEDIEKTMEFCIKRNLNKLSEIPYYKNTLIQSLSTQQLPKEFIPEYEYKENLEVVEELKDRIGISPRVTKITKVFKTITNSEGKEEICGTYKY